MIKFLKTIQLRCVSASFFLTSRIECVDLLCFRVRLQGTRTFNYSDLKLQHMNRKRTDIRRRRIDSSRRRTDRRRNDRIPSEHRWQFCSLERKPSKKLNSAIIIYTIYTIYRRQPFHRSYRNTAHEIRHTSILQHYAPFYTSLSHVQTL